MSNENPTSAPRHTWAELIANLSRGRSGDEIAVHRPLLILLLSRARRAGSNRVAFCQIKDELTEAIKRFGPAEKPGGAELPFWHLKNSDFWVIENEDQLPLQKDKNRPTKGTLIEYNAT